MEDYEQEQDDGQQWHYQMELEQRQLEEENSNV
jgi:hypothetical protein